MSVNWRAAGGRWVIEHMESMYDVRSRARRSSRGPTVRFGSIASIFSFTLLALTTRCVLVAVDVNHHGLVLVDPTVAITNAAALERRTTTPSRIKTSTTDTREAAGDN